MAPSSGLTYYLYTDVCDNSIDSSIAARPWLWNNLSVHIRRPDLTLEQFYPQGQYWAGRTLPPYNLPPNMAANDLRCSEMPHYCRVVIRV